jgi:hypothetical protein
MGGDAVVLRPTACLIPAQGRIGAPFVHGKDIHLHIASTLLPNPGMGRDAVVFRPTACLIPAQGIRPGFMAPFSQRRPTACFIALRQLLLVRCKDESRLQRWKSCSGRWTHRECPGLVWLTPSASQRHPQNDIGAAWKKSALRPTAVLRNRRAAGHRKLHEYARRRGSVTALGLGRAVVRPSPDRHPGDAPAKLLSHASATLPLA